MELKYANNLVGTAGEYYVCAEICMLGYLALLTPKNNPIFDVVATTQDGSRSVSIQVKTRSVKNKQGWKFGGDIAKENASAELFVVLVNLKSDSSPEFYIYEYPVLSSRVNEVYLEYIKQRKRDGTLRKEVDFRWFDEKSFLESDRLRKNNWQPIIDALS